MAESASDLQLRELRDTISELNSLIRSLQESVAAANVREAAMRTENEKLQEQIEYLIKKLYGTSSEKRPFDIPGQMNLFNEAEAEALSEETEEAPVQVSKPRKAKTVQAEKLKGLPTEKVYLDLPEEEKVCEKCGTVLEKIGEEFVRREIRFIPAKLKVIEYYSYTYNCPNCEELELPHMIKGKERHPHKLHGMASASTVAWVMYQKYRNCVPLYRQEQDWKMYGLDIGRATLANWIIRNADDFFRPMYEMFRRKLLQRGFLMADETPVQVLKEPDRKAQTTSYMWIFRTGEDDGPPIVLYKYSETRAGATAVDFLDGYSGYFMSDGYSGYNKLSDAKRCTCWAHVRRYLLDAVPKSKQYDYSHPAVQGLLYVEKLFRLEKEIHSHTSNPEKIKENRIEKEMPVLEGFFRWLDLQSPNRGTRLDKAVTYIRNRKPYLTTYLEDGRCSFSNNASERSVKPFVMGRKNWLFSDTPKGADASSLVYTMVEMANANGVNVYYYLQYLLEHCPESIMSDDELERFAPWNPEVKEAIVRMQNSGSGIPG